MSIWVKKIVINFNNFRVINRNRVEESIPVLFKDNKTYIQFRKSISNIGKIKYINIIFHEIKDKFEKSNIFL